jgi:kynureninase
MRHLTIRQVPPELARALDEEKRRRGTSLNRTVIDLLAQTLGLRPHAPRSNGLAALAGKWSKAELVRFEKAVALTEQIDEELWR